MSGSLIIDIVNCSFSSASGSVFSRGLLRSPDTCGRVPRRTCKLPIPNIYCNENLPHIFGTHAMTKAQLAAYDRACKTIHRHFGSFNSMSLRAQLTAGEAFSQETIRLWFRDRKIPAEFVFKLYELMDCSGFDPLDLLPYMRPFVLLKREDGPSAS